MVLASLSARPPSTLDVEHLLETWWRPFVRSGSQESDASISETGKARKSPARKQTKTRTDESVDADAFDPNEFANRVKEDPRFQTFEKKILHVKADWYNKTAFVLWLVERPLTSGQIHRALQALDITGQLARVSTALDKNANSFLTSGQRKKGATVDYRLSAKARADFETWVMKKAEPNGGE